MSLRLAIQTASVLFVGVCLLTACAEKTTSISYLAVNHTDEEIEAVFVNDQGGVLNVPAKGGGGGQICCVTLPRTWRPGLTARIKWEPLSRYKRDSMGAVVMKDGVPTVVRSAYKEKTVEIPRYTERDLEHFDIHFFDGDDVKVVVSRIVPYHDTYPYFPYPTPKEKREVNR